MSCISGQGIQISNANDCGGNSVFNCFSSPYTTTGQTASGYFLCNGGNNTWNNVSATNLLTYLYR